MVRKAQRKNKRTMFVWITNLLILGCIAAYVFTSYMNIYLISNIFSPLFSTANSTSAFYGENVDMSQILPTSQHYVVNRKGEDLIDIAADLGINLIRITNAVRSFNNDNDSLYTRDQWNQVLDKMHSKGIKALILIETASNNSDYYAPEIRPAYLHLVKEYIDSGVFSNPDVYAVDIRNEPILTDANVTMLQAAHMMIKAMYPDLKQTIGWWATARSSQDPYNPNNYNWSDFSAGRKINTVVDFYSIHMYGLDTNNFGIGLSPDLKTKVFVSRVENGLQTTKPILIEEFGEANGDAVSDQNTIGSPQLQASVYQGVYQALEEMHNSQLLGAVAFDFYSRNHYPDAWAIVKDNGNYLFLAASILQGYALGKNESLLQKTTVVHSQNYLVTDDDNNTTETLNASDRIGLKLQLDNSKDYTLSLSDNTLLQPTEPFHYDPASNSYYAVYQAVGAGNVQLNIISNINGIPVYTVTINVQ